MIKVEDVFKNLEKDGCDFTIDTSDRRSINIFLFRLWEEAPLLCYDCDCSSKSEVLVRSSYYEDSIFVQELSHGQSTHIISTNLEIIARFDNWHEAHSYFKEKVLREDDSYDLCAKEARKLYIESIASNIV